MGYLQRQEGRVYGLRVSVYPGPWIRCDRLSWQSKGSDPDRVFRRPGLEHGNDGSLARESISSPSDETGYETLTFLAATLAMLCEGIVLLLLGPAEIHYALLLLFSGPAIVTLLMIVILARKLPHRAAKSENIELKILPILKLAAVIILILTVSKILQAFFGQSGLIVLTFLVSLFEIHGSVIANIQMHDAGAFTVKFLGGLLAISASASYISKLFLVHTMGSRGLRARVIKYTGILFLALVLSWVVFMFVV